MADAESDLDKKRKRSEKSSVSDLDNSVDVPKTTGKAKKKKKKEDNMDEHIKKVVEESSSGIASQLKAINKKLANVITKDDSTLQNLIRETFKEMKEELLKSVSHRIDILEGKLFEKEQENDELKTKVKDLQTVNETLRTRTIKKVVELEEDNLKLEEDINNLEQYGRRNSIRIFGIPEGPNETAEQTAQAAAEILNARIPNVNIKRYNVDIAHRLGNKTDGTKPRPIIMKFNSRMTRDAVFSGRRSLKNTNIFVNEDLTRENNYILTCVRKKKCEEIDSAWTVNGKIFYKNKDKLVHEVKYKNFQYWKDLDWPDKRF